MTRFRPSWLTLLCALFLAACGGGGGSDSNPPPPAGARIGGTVSGLAGTGLVLQNNAGDDLALAAGATTFQFATPIASGNTYAVTVKTQPTNPAQQCAVTDGSGTSTGADVTNIVVTCTTAYQVGGSVTTLAGTGLVLQNNGADDLSVPANATSFVFPTALASGASYDVTVRTQPTNPAQECVVANGSGTVSTANVTSVSVTCSTVSRALTTTVAGLAAGETLTLNASFNGVAAAVPVTANGIAAAASRASLAPGTVYAITVTTPPATKTCTVTNGAGTVAGSDVAVTVTCSATGFTVGGTVSGLTAAGLRLHDSASSEDLDVPAGANAFTFTQPVASGAPYAVTVSQQPAGVTCQVANGTGTMGAANVTNVVVTCNSSIVQRWTAPTVWGGLWQPSPTMVQHAYFDGTTIVEDPAATGGVTWTAQGGEPPKRQFSGFPAGPRFGAGPFTTQRYQATNDAAVDAVTGDMIACAVFKPDYNKPVGQERPIFANGITNDEALTNGGGWALTQTRNRFEFHYNYLALTDGLTRHTAAWIPTFFADETAGTANDPASVQVVPNSGPLNPSYVVFCGGRAGRQIIAAVNSVGVDYSTSSGHYGADLQNVGPEAATQFTQLDVGNHPLTIGGYDTGDANKVFGGRVYETAIWNEPGTPENIQAKMSEILGLNGAARYSRNREAAFYGVDRVDGQPAAGYHGVWNDAPRIDAQRGFLFGLQSWNRLSGYASMNVPDPAPFYVYALGEDLSFAAIPGVVRPSPLTDPPGTTPGWTAAGGVTFDQAGPIEPPGDSEAASVRLVTMPVGSSLRAPVRPFATLGQIHGQIWLRLPAAATGKLRIELGYSGVDGSDLMEIDLAQLPVNEWTRLWLYRAPGGLRNELVTPGTGTTVTLQPHPDNTAPVSFYAWGFQLTQIGTAAAPGSGVSLNEADPGAEMYDWSSEKGGGNSGRPAITVDALQLSPVQGSTAASGFCLSADATMPASIPWNAPFTLPRTALAWVNSLLSPTQTVQLYLSAKSATEPSPRLCLAVTGGTPVCADIPAAFAAGSRHTITGCVSAAGQVRIHADAGAALATGTAGVAVPDLSGGTLLVGGSSVVDTASSNPFHGYISKAVICRDTTNLASCQ